MYRVAIRRNETGEIRMRSFEFPWEGDSTLFWWTDGNMACDCNRGREFARVTDENAESCHLDPDWDCSDSRYSVLYAELEDGTKVQIDDEDIDDEHNK